MTLDKLLKLSGEKFEALSDEELLQYFIPFLPHTRPIQKEKKSSPALKVSSHKSKMHELMSLISEANKIARQ